ncbi:Uncharacterised protein [Vibrio cholerae]|nr:Uncharacterised protein [Vibrio cholerae]
MITIFPNVFNLSQMRLGRLVCVLTDLRANFRSRFPMPSH